jgi:hypothetical protein
VSNPTAFDTDATTAFPPIAPPPIAPPPIAPPPIAPDPAAEQTPTPTPLWFRPNEP